MNGGEKPPDPKKSKTESFFSMFRSEDKKTGNEIAEKDERIKSLEIALSKTSNELEDNRKTMKEEARKTAEILITESVI